MSGHSKWATTKHKKAVIDARRGKMVAKLIKNVDYLAAAGSIVSVEARHAATIALLLRGYGREAAGGKNVDLKGLDKALEPKTVLKAAGPFIATEFTANSLV